MRVSRGEPEPLQHPRLPFRLRGLVPASTSVTMPTCAVEGNLFQPPDLEITHRRLVLQWVTPILTPKPHPHPHPKIHL